MRVRCHPAITTAVLILGFGTLVVAQEESDNKQPGKLLIRTERGLIEIPVHYDAVLFDLGVFPDSLKQTEPWRFIGDLKVRAFATHQAEDSVVTLSEQGQMKGVVIKSPELAETLKALDMHRLVKASPFAPGDTLDWDSGTQKWHSRPDVSNLFEIHFQSCLPPDSAVAILKKIPGILSVSRVSRFEVHQRKRQHN